ncbi:MAG: HAMP domain-containing protein [Gemmatimonas sp.]|nr:HAMP domain-containing protein [Gemmatimonas sp.]
MSGISIRTKVFFLLAVAMLVTVVPVLVLIGQAVEERVYDRATQELIAGNEALRTYWRVQDDALLETARRVALERGVAEQLLEGDTARLQRTFQQEVVPRLVVIAVDSMGRTVVGPQMDTTALQLGTQEGSLVVFPPDSEAPLRLAIWPVYTDSGYAGVVGVGSRLDSGTIRELRDVTGGADIALIFGDSVLGTTLPNSLVRVLATLDLPVVAQRGGIWRRVVERLPYLYFASPLPTQGTPASVLLLRPVAQELRLAQSIRSYVLGIGAVALLLALALSFLVSRIVARPAQTLAAAAAELAKGNFNAPLPSTGGSDEVGQLTRTFGEMRSAIAEREARLRSAQAELIHREKLAAMGRLVAQLSHEINNPIYNIQNCLEVLDHRGDPGDPNREFLLLAREELQRMAVLTRQLLDQSRPLSDAATRLDVNQLVQRVLTLATGGLERNRVRVELRLKAELPNIVAHPDAIQQVLANLVANAIDAMPTGGSLRISTESDEESVEVVVEDSGPGIPDEQLPHIFEAFYTTKPGIRGVGLGLFVSEGIIRGHRGNLRVDSRVGEGTRFIIRLPRETLNSSLLRAHGLEREEEHAGSA